jgi:hypothetical protein
MGSLKITHSIVDPDSGEIYLERSKTNKVLFFATPPMGSKKIIIQIRQCKNL